MDLLSNKEIPDKAANPEVLVNWIYMKGFIKRINKSILINNFDSNDCNLFIKENCSIIKEILKIIIWIMVYQLIFG